MAAVKKILAIAAEEVGYLEKRSNASLYDKTANAGSANYTKYWAEIKPDYQGQPWCACFVTWCLVQAFGKDKAAELLGHYPYVYCPTGLAKAKAQGRWAQVPSLGAVVIFGNAAGTASHTGLVYDYDNIYVYTIEGNTSAGSTVIANGGAVCRKSYRRDHGRILGYWALDYEGAEGEDIDMEQLQQLQAELDAVKQELAAVKAETVGKMVYNYIDENMPAWARDTVRKLADTKALRGDENGRLMLTDEMLRMLVVLDRCGVFGK